MPFTETRLAVSTRLIGAEEPYVTVKAFTVVDPTVPLKTAGYAMPQSQGVGEHAPYG
jgi:hypothetical protein